MAELKGELELTLIESKASAKKADIATSRLADLSKQVVKLEGTVDSLVGKVKELLKTNK